MSSPSSLMSPARPSPLFTSVARRLSALRRARRRARALPPAPEWHGLEPLEPRLLLSADVVDATFGSGGVVLKDFEESAHDALAEVLVQEDGKIVAVGETGSPLGGSLRDARITWARYLPDGSVDESFGENGRMATTFTGNVSQAAVAGAMVEEDGGILTVGTLGGAVVLMRHDASGFPDADFGTDGIQLALLGPRATAGGMARDAGGNIIVAGRVAPSIDFSDLFVARFTPDGELDPTFGEDGSVTMSFGDGWVNDSASSVVADEQGIIVAGSSDGDVVLARLDSSGNLVEDFGTVRAFPGAEDVSAASIALDGEGGIILTGTIDSDFLLARYHGDGALDTDFGDGGWVRADFHGGVDAAERVLIDAEGRILLVGTAQDGPESEAGTSFAAARYHASGDPDSGFGEGGKLTRDLSDADRGSAVALDSDSRIVFGGSAWNTGNGTRDFAVMRHDGDGDADPAFGNADEALGQTGLVLTDFPSRAPDRAQAVITQEDGSVLVAGLTPEGSVTGLWLNPVVMRYHPDGTLDTNFGGGNGWAAATQSVDNAGNVSMAVDGDGRIVLAFNQFVSGSFWWGVARFTPDGLLDEEFGSEGVTFLPLGSDGVAGDLAVDQEGGVVVTGRHDGDVLTVRFTADGALDESFGEDGFATTNFSDRRDTGTAVAIDDQGRIVVAAEAFGDETGLDFAVIRYTADGTLDESFGGGAGYALTDFHGSSDRPRDLVIDAEGRILLAGSARDPDGPDSLALARFDEAGELDAGFGDGGLVHTPNEWAVGQIALDEQGRIVLAGTAAESWFGDPGNAPRGDVTFALVRYHSDGTIDTTLDGDDGFVTTDLGTQSFSVANAVAVDAQGRIVVAGSARMAVTGDDFAMVRYAPLSVGLELESPWIARGDDQSLTGVVTRSGDFSDPLELSLTSSDAGELEVPERVVVEAGEGSVSFELWSVGEVGAGAQTVTIAASVTVDDQEHASTADVDVVDLPNLSGVVFDDLDDDGFMDAGEDGLGGVTVLLSGETDRGDVELDTVTGSDGLYVFEGLRPGVYRVSAEWPDGYLDGVVSVGDLGGAVEGGAIAGIAVAHDDPDGEGYDFAFVQASRIAGVVWDDLDADGLRDSVEPGLDGVEVRLSGTNTRGEAVSQTLLTDGDGSYAFADLRPGTYDVTVVPPFNSFDGTVTLGEGDVLFGDTAGDIRIGGDQPDAVGYDFGLVPATAVAGAVFDDANANMTRDEGEAAVAGAAVRLRGTDHRGTAVEITDVVTDDEGAYAFDRLRPGTYEIAVAPPDGFLDGTATAGEGAEAVSGAALAGIVLDGHNPDASGYDFALIRPSSVAGLVWEDFNADGEQNFGEGAAEGVGLVLRGTDYRGVEVELDDIATDSEGRYHFDGLRPGDYTITAEHDADVLGEAAPLAIEQPEPSVTDHDFGARPAEEGLVPENEGHTATVEFWEGKDGRKLIESLNGGRNDTQLSAWLAATFPNLYGADAGQNNLSGMTNREVHRFMRDLAKAADDDDGGGDDGDGDGGNGGGNGNGKGPGGGGPPGQNKQSTEDADATTLETTGEETTGTARLDAEVLALALSVYVTHAGLAGGDMAADFGFAVTRLGVGVHTFSVGGSGDAFGSDDGDELNIMDILLATDGRSSGGVLYDGDDDLRRSALDVYRDLNARGGIV